MAMFIVLYLTNKGEYTMLHKSQDLQKMST